MKKLWERRKPDNIFLMRITILPLAFFLSAMIFLGSCNTAYALEEIGQSRIHPAHPLYFLKAIRENLELKFAGTTKVVYIRRLEFATRRLREVKSLIGVGRFELITPALENYLSQINALPDKGMQDEEVLKMIGDNLSIHLEVLQRLYSQIENPGAKMAIRSTMNRIMQREDLPGSARENICNFMEREASSSALNEVEKTVLLQRAEKCFSYDKNL